MISVFPASKEREVLILDAMARKGSRTIFRSFAKRKSATARRGRNICLSGDKRCTVGAGRMVGDSIFPHTHDS